MAAAKDVKILDREDDLIYQVEKNNFTFTKANQIAQFFGGLPKFFFEILIVLAFSIITFVMIFSGKDMLGTIQYLTVFAVGSFRIVPAVNKFLTSYQLIKYIEPSVKILIREFNTNNKKIIQLKDNNKILKFSQEISLKNLNFSYPLRKEFSLSNISMTVKKGNFIGIIGETGSGKSTLVNLIIGLLKPSSGKIEVDKIDISSNLQQWYQKIGYVPQSIYLTDDSIRKNIAFGLHEDDINDELVKMAIKKANLNNFLDSLPAGLNTIVGEKGIRLSGGQQQRIGIARALYRDPEILILDESTSSLDQDTEKKIMESIQFLKKEKTLIVITHRLVTVKNCDEVFYIKKGQLIKQGDPKEILREI
jgi:ABC-type multidrug transport system fused ATPase/permease subunit